MTIEEFKTKLDAALKSAPEPWENILMTTVRALEKCAAGKGKVYKRSGSVPDTFDVGVSFDGKDHCLFIIKGTGWDLEVTVPNLISASEKCQNEDEFEAAILGKLRSPMAVRILRDMRLSGLGNDKL